MDAKTKLIYYDKVAKFIISHNELYTSREMLTILDYMRYGTYPDMYHKEIIREILEELSLIPEEENIYDAFAKEIDEIHPVEGKNIVEVGSGIFPHLGKRLSLKQTSGTITIYDPRLSPSAESTDRMILKKEQFTRSTNVDNVDLIIGQMPCEGAEKIIDQAIEHEIDYIIWLCEGGPHGDCFDYYEDEEEWANSIIITAKRGTKEKNMGEFKQKFLEKYSKTYPIIYNLKK